MEAKSRPKLLYRITYVKLYHRYPNTPSWRGAQLKHRDNFTFTFTFTFYQGY